MTLACNGCKTATKRSAALTLIEGKRKAKMIAKINHDFQKHIRDSYKALRITNKNEKCFLSHKKVVYSTQRINVLFKEIKTKYHLKVEHFSTHTMRKTFGRKVFESAGENANMALMRLSELFNYSTIQAHE